MFSKCMLCIVWWNKKRKKKLEQTFYSLIRVAVRKPSWPVVNWEEKHNKKKESLVKQEKTKQ